METIYSTCMYAKELKAMAKVAKAIDETVTLGLDAEAKKDYQFRFWTTDAQKKCALVGGIDVDHEDATGAVMVVVPTTGLVELLDSFSPKASLGMSIVEDGSDEEHPLSLRLEDLGSGETRSMTVKEAPEEDAPYARKMGKGRPACTVPSALLHKVVASFKKSADVVDVFIGFEGLQVSYEARDSKDRWVYAAKDATGDEGSKFSAPLLAAATTACKLVGPTVTLTLAEKSMRLGASREGFRCRVYVARNEAI